MTTRSKPQEVPPVPTRSSSRLKNPSTKAAATTLAGPPPRARTTRNLAGLQSQDPSTSRRGTKATAVEQPTTRRVLSGKDNTAVGQRKDLGDSQGSKKSTKDQTVRGKELARNASAFREPLKAYLRIRPSPTDEPAYPPYLNIVSDTTVSMNGLSSTQNRRLTTSTIQAANYTFTHVFPPGTTQTDFFKEVALPLVGDVLKGDNGLIFAYGVTNSGKTYTVQGGKGPGEGGLIPRTLDVVFNSVGDSMSDAPIRPLRVSGVETFDDVSPVELPEETRLSEILSALKQQTTVGDSQDDAKFEVDAAYEYAVWVSYVEVYNEKIFDLLAGDESDTPEPSQGKAGTLPRSNTLNNLPSRPSIRNSFIPSFTFASGLSSLATTKNGPTPVLTRKALHLKTDVSSPRGGKYVAGLREVRVRTSAEARQALQAGQINRRVFGTLANKESSRSHAVFTIKVLRVRKGTNFLEDPSAVQVSRLSIVDLAGSERHRNTQNTGERLKEAGSINKSLMVLGQCMEVMRSNQRKAMAAAGEVVNRTEKLMVPFWYSKLTELFQDFFEGDGKVAMVVNVNPYDTGIDENTHVMKFAALARDVTTQVVETKPQIGVSVQPSRIPQGQTNRRTVAMAVRPSDNGKENEAMWEVAEEDNGSDESSEDLIDRLFEIIDDLREKLYEAELRNAMAEVEIRAQVTEEFEERMQEMERNFNRRRMNDEEEFDAKLDKKIDLLYKAGLFGGQPGTTTEEHDELVDDGDEEEDGDRTVEWNPDNTDDPPSPTPPVNNSSTIMEPQSQRTSNVDSDYVSAQEGLEECEDTETAASDDEWFPTKGSGSKEAKSKSKLHSNEEYETVKVSNNAVSKPKKAAPKPVAFDVSLDEIPVIPLKKIKSQSHLVLLDDGVENVMGDTGPEVVKRKKRQLGKKSPVTESQILEVAHRVEEDERQAGGHKTAVVPRMGS